MLVKLFAAKQEKQRKPLLLKTMITRYTGSKKEQRRKKRHTKVRGRISGTAERPRVCVSRSLQHVYAQAIDDIDAKTLVAASDLELAEADQKGTKSEKAHKVGALLGKKLLDKKISTVVFDRGGYRYHGRIKSLAEGIRTAGIIV
jgi:large subunit ribosomal protein L18